jgi:PhnB protein
VSFTPYLFFVGTCREAMTAYQGIFGGQLDIVTAAELPDAPPDAPADTVMHAALTVDGGAMLFASDDPTGEPGGAKVGISVSVQADTPDDVNRIFDALAGGGQVTLPVSETSWSKAFGMCTDRFGVPWMVGTGPAE